MKYFEEIDAWLSAVLLVDDDDDDEEVWFARVKKQIKEKLLESYRNGQKSAGEGRALAADGKPREQKRKFWPRRQGQ
jgi:hypothetical protein